MENLYNKSFKITENVGNNVFCFDEVENPTIYIPKLISVSLEKFTLDIDKYTKLGQETVFREKNNNNKIIEYKGLQNFIEIKHKKFPLLGGEVGGGNIYIFDNHNHALYFRYKEYFDGNISKGANLIHIDQHTDMNNNKCTIESVAKQSINSKTIFTFTNKNCNVGNFINPAIEEGLIGDITQINTEYKLLTTYYSNISYEILDIDLDFRAPEMSIEKYQETIEITKNLIKNSRVVTIATSPYFLDQALATKIIKDLFN